MENMSFAGTLEAALIELDPFYAGFALKGCMNYGIGHQPCFAPSVTRNRNMKTIREMEMFPERFPSQEIA